MSAWLEKEAGCGAIPVRLGVSFGITLLWAWCGYLFVRWFGAPLHESLRSVKYSQVVCGIMLIGLMQSFVAKPTIKQQTNQQWLERVSIRTLTPLLLAGYGWCMKELIL